VSKHQSKIEGSTKMAYLRSAIVAVCIALLQVHGGSQQSDSPPGKAVGTARLILPDVIPAVVGVEIAVYFDNLVVVPDSSSLLFDVTCPKGRQQADRWVWTPKDGDAGDYSLQVDIRDSANQIIATSDCIVRVVNQKQGGARPVSLLCVGDSLTHASVYTQRLLDRCRTPEDPVLTLIGSHQPNEQQPLNRHEGYGGWTARRFATFFQETARTGPAAQRGSPFLYPAEDSGSKLDFAQYRRDVCEGRPIDVVTIFLGPNDIFHFDDQTIEAGIEEMLTHMDLLLTMIHKDSPETQIGLMLPVPAAASQDAFGASYGSGQTRWQYKRNQHLLLERMLQRYSGEKADILWGRRVHIIPTYVSLDCVHNYPTVSVPANAATEQLIQRQNDGVHPSAAGYNQIGDMVYAWLKTIADQ
jgi:hypothetical protein